MKKWSFLQKISDFPDSSNFPEWCIFSFKTFKLIDSASTTLDLSFATKIKALTILVLELQKILRSHQFDWFWKKIAIEKSADISNIMARFCFHEHITLFYLSASLLSNLDKNFKSDRCFKVYGHIVPNPPPNSRVHPKAQYH